MCKLHVRGGAFAPVKVSQEMCCQLHIDSGSEDAFASVDGNGVELIPFLSNETCKRKTINRLTKTIIHMRIRQMVRR